MEPIETTGKNVKEATQAAADQLGVAPESLVVTVLEESKGLFGKAQVRIRAQVAEVVEAPAPPDEAPAEPAPAKPKPRSRAKAKAAAPVEVAVEPTPEAPAEAPADSESEDEEPTQGQPPVEASEEDAALFVALLRTLLKSASLEVTVQCSHVNGRYVNLEIDGRDVAHLVGKHGEVLNALQYLLNIIASRKLPRGVRATVDGNNYRQRREQALQALATKIAEQVRSRGEEAVLDALPAFERRIVHKALDGIDGVTTYSEGEEPNRRVVIAPVE